MNQMQWSNFFCGLDCSEKSCRKQLDQSSREPRVLNKPELALSTVNFENGSASAEELQYALDSLPPEDPPNPYAQGMLEISRRRFPRHLGPIFLRNASWSQEKVVLDSQGTIGQQLSSIDCDSSVWFWPIKAGYSPLQPLASIPNDDWKRLFPQDVIDLLPKTFAWSHPVAIDFAKAKKAVLFDPNRALYGGFVLYDDKGSVCAVSTIGEQTQDSCSMYFGKPMPWLPRWTLVLRDRFQRITMTELKGRGACYYCWICPDDPALRFLDPPTLPHGGFAFLFHDDFGFPVSGVQDVVFPLEKIEPPSTETGSYFV